MTITTSLVMALVAAIIAAGLYWRLRARRRRGVEAVAHAETVRRQHQLMAYHGEKLADPAARLPECPVCHEVYADVEDLRTHMADH